MNTTLTSFSTARVCGVVLGGGRALRMGGVDKGLQLFRGEPLAAIALERLRQQTLGPPGQLAINANRNQEHYAAFGVPVWSDSIPDFAGPLAGMLSAMQRAAQDFDYVLTVPCDSPLLPLDLLARLSGALVATGSMLAMASAADSVVSPSNQVPTTLRRQPVFCLVRTSLAGDLADFLQSGGRKIDTWCERHAMTTVAFNAPGDNPNAFANANTLLELHDLEQL